jgi:outer membrane receptor for ferrienterochelin and colicins
MNEEREGGTRPGQTTPDGLPFPNNQDTRRFDAGVVAEFPLAELGAINLRASGMTQDHRHVFGSIVEDDMHETGFAEASFAAVAGDTSWLVGAAVQADAYSSETFSGFDYTYTTPGIFTQVEHELTDEVTVAASARWDNHSEYGSHFSPRLTLLYRPGPFRVRASYGEGFHAPTPFVEEIEAAGLARLEPLGALEAETAQTGSIDVGYQSGPVELGATLFMSDIDQAVQLQDVDTDSVRLINAAGPTRTRGGELLARYRWESFTFTGSYVHVHATESDASGAGRRTVPVTPRDTAGFVAMWEEHGIGRIGFEAYYTGDQELTDNPYRTRSRPYVELGLLGEIVLGNVSLYANAENILDVRQTDYDPLLRTIRAPDGRWTVDAWAPLDGFTVNVGLRLKFGGD